jgi:hypothetical protein
MRERMGLGPDETIPDVVLVREALGAFEPRHLAGARWYMGFRLAGLADTQRERDAVALRMRERRGPVPWGLITYPRSPHRARRGAPATRGLTS